MIRYAQASTPLTRGVRQVLAAMVLLYFCVVRKTTEVNCLAITVYIMGIKDLSFTSHIEYHSYDF